MGFKPDLDDQLVSFSAIIIIIIIIYDPKGFGNKKLEIENVRSDT